MDGVLLRAGVPVADPFELQLIGGIQPLFQREAVLKAERFRIFEKFPHGGDIETLLVQFCKLFQNAADPLGKTGGRTEIEQELRDRQALFQCQPNQVGIGRAVAHQQQGQVDDIGPEVGRLPPEQEAVVEPHRALPEFFHPLPQAKDADILAVLPVGGDLLHVGQPLHIPGFLLAVAVAPLVDPPGRQIADDRCGADQQAEPGVQAGQQQQVGPEAEEVGQDLAPAHPECFDGFIVGAPGPVGLGAQIQKALVQQVRVGGAGPLAGREVQDIDPDVHFSKEIQFAQITLQEGQCDQQHGKTANDRQQTAQRHPLFQHPEHRRGKQQLHDGPACRDQRQREADREHRPMSAPPCHAQHIGRDLPEVVFWFLLRFVRSRFHVGFPFRSSGPILPQKIVPGTDRGRTVHFGG